MSETIPPRLMLVDDELAYLETLIKRLTRRGYAVRSAGGGQEALDELARDPDVDVVVLDVRMPGLDGIETLRRLKERHPLIEVVMLTGHASVEAAIRGMEIGAFDYLMKPVELDDLIYKIQDACKKKRLQEGRLGAGRSAASGAEPA